MPIDAETFGLPLSSRIDASVKRVSRDFDLLNKQELHPDNLRSVLQTLVNSIRLIESFSDDVTSEDDLAALQEAREQVMVGFTKVVAELSENISDNSDDVQAALQNTLLQFQMMQRYLHSNVSRSFKSMAGSARRRVIEAELSKLEKIDDDLWKPAKELLSDEVTASLNEKTSPVNTSILAVYNQLKAADSSKQWLEIASAVSPDSSELSRITRKLSQEDRDVLEQLPLQQYARELTNEYGAGRKNLSSEMYSQVLSELNNARTQVERVREKYQGTSDKNLADYFILLQQVIERLSHEYRVTFFQRDEEYRQFFRPSLRDVDARTYAQVVGMLDEHYAGINRAEDVGEVLAAKKQAEEYGVDFNLPEGIRENAARILSQLKATRETLFIEAQSMNAMYVAARELGVEEGNTGEADEIRVHAEILDEYVVWIDNIVEQFEDLTKVDDVVDAPLPTPDPDQDDDTNLIDQDLDTDMDDDEQQPAPINPHTGLSRTEIKQREAEEAVRNNPWVLVDMVDRLIKFAATQSPPKDFGQGVFSSSGNPDMNVLYNQVTHIWGVADEMGSEVQTISGFTHSKVGFYNMYNSILEPTGGIKHQVLQNLVLDSNKAQWGPFLGSPEIFFEIVHDLTGAYTSPTGEYENPNKREQSNIFTERLREVAIDILNDSTPPYDRFNVRTMIGKKKDPLFQAVLEKLQHSPSGPDDVWPQLMQHLGTVQNVESKAEQILNWLWDLVYLDLLDVAFIPDRAKGSSMAHNNENPEGGSIEVGGVKASSYTDALSPIAAFGYDINNKLFADDSSQAILLFQKDEVVAATRQSISGNRSRDFYEKAMHYYETIFSKDQADFLFGNLEVDVNEPFVPSISMALEHGYVRAIGEYYVALGGYLKMYELLFEDIKKPISDAVFDDKIQKWFSGAVGKYKLFRSGANEDWILFASRLYLARLIHARGDVTTKRFETYQIKNVLAQASQSLFNASTVKGMSGGEAIDLKMRLIKDLFWGDFNNGGAGNLELDLLDALRRNEMVGHGRHKGIIDVVKKLSPSPWLLPENRTAAKARHALHESREIKPLTGPGGGIKRALTGFLREWGFIETPDHSHPPTKRPVDPDKH